EREEEVTDDYAWGAILVRTSRRNFKLTVSFQALEDNDVVRGLVWPASPPGEIVVPRPPRVKIAFETREGSKIKRLISRHAAEVTVSAAITEAEGDLTRFPLVAPTFSDASGVLFDEPRQVVAPYYPWQYGEASSHAAQDRGS